MPDVSVAGETVSQSAWLEALVGSVPHSLIGFSLDGTIAYWSGAATACYGWQASEVIGLPVCLIAPCQDDLNRVLAQVATGAVLELHCPVRMNKQGQALRVRGRALPVRDSQNQVAGVLLVEEMLDEAAQGAAQDGQLLAYVAQLPHLFWAACADGRLEYASPQWVRFFGQDQAWRGVAWFDALHPEDQERLRDAWPGITQAAAYYEDDIRLGNPNGAWRWFKLRLVPVHDQERQVFRWLGSCSDIDDQKGFQQALRESESVHRLLFEKARDGIVLFQLPAPGVRGYFLQANPTFCQMLGYTADELGRMTLADLQLPEEGRNITESLEAMFREGATRFEKILVGKHGRQVPTEVQVSFFNRNGQTLVMAMIRDMTVWKSAEQGFREQAKALAEADHHKDAFLAMLAHELRNPLAPVRHAINLLRTRGPQVKETQRHYAMIDRQVSHMARLLDDLLDVARVARGKINLNKEPLPLARLLEQAAEGIQPLAQARKQGFEVSLPPEGLQVAGDAVRLMQVLGNLLNNAVKYTPEGGQIRLSAAASEGLAVIRVQDNGNGIEPGRLPKLFDYFNRDRSLDSPAGGLGLGLTLAKNLVELHGGRIEAFSQGSGQGSEFVVWLPLEKKPAAAAGPPPKRRVLVVEDVADSAQSLAELMEWWGFEVRVAYSGREGLDAFQTYQPEAAVLDVGLPEMDGLELAQQIRRLNPACRVIGLSGYGQEADRRKAAAAGMVHYLVKPVDPEALKRLLDPEPGLKSPESVPVASRALQAG